MPLRRLNLNQTELWNNTRKWVLVLDCHQCAICGRIGKLHVHHLNNRYKTDPDANIVPELITLCPKCHSIFTGIIVKLANRTGRYTWDIRLSRVEQIKILNETRQIALDQKLIEEYRDSEEYKMKLAGVRK